METRGIVIGHNDIPARRRRRHLALRSMHERPETGEDLSVIQGWITGLLIAASKLDLGFRQDTGYGRSEIRKNNVPHNGLVGIHSGAGPHLHFDSELRNI